MILGICVTLFAMSAVRLGSVQWLFVSGMFPTLEGRLSLCMCA